MKAIQVVKSAGRKLSPYAMFQPGRKPMKQSQIKAAGVNFIDVYFREGRYRSLPFIVGTEAAGVVTSVGSEANRVKSGDRVAYTGIPGSYAEYAAVPNVVTIQRTDFSKAAAAML